MRPNTGCCELVPNCKWSLLGSLPATGGMGPKWPAMPTESLRIELNMIMQVGHFCDVRVMLMTLLVLLETQAVVRWLRWRPLSATLLSSLTAG